MAGRGSQGVNQRLQQLIDWTEKEQDVVNTEAGDFLLNYMKTFSSTFNNGWNRNN